MNSFKSDIETTYPSTAFIRLLVIVTGSIVQQEISKKDKGDF